jgi:hypothetical protein
MKRFDSRWVSGRALPGIILVMAVLSNPTPAAAHCGEHSDSCGVPEWREVSGGGCEDAADPYAYGTWWQPYQIWATWCFRPVMCVPATCGPETPCGIGRTCVNGACNCPPGPRAECASCGEECLYSEQELPFDNDSRCWPSGIEERVPCAGPRAGGSWRNHGAYVSALAHLLNVARGDGLISESQRDALMEAGAQSSCGRK